MEVYRYYRCFTSATVLGGLQLILKKKVASKISGKKICQNFWLVKKHLGFLGWISVET